MSISVLFSGPAVAQILIASFALAAVTFVPPAQGRILIVSLNGETDAAITRWAIDTGARIVDRGPIAGSMVVEGRARDILGLALRNGAIFIAAPASGCGAGAKR